MWILIGLRVNGGVDGCACVDEGVILCRFLEIGPECLRARAGALISAVSTNTSGGRALKPSARSAAISEAQQGK